MRLTKQNADWPLWLPLYELELKQLRREIKSMIAKGKKLKSKDAKEINEERVLARENCEELLDSRVRFLKREQRSTKRIGGAS